MSEVKRYTFEHAWNGTGAMREFEHGEYVAYADLAALEQRLKEAEATITELRRSRIADSEIIGRWQCQAENAEQRIAVLEEALREAREFIENQQLPDTEWARVLDVVVAALASAQRTGGKSVREVAAEREFSPVSEAQGNKQFDLHTKNSTSRTGGKK